MIIANYGSSQGFDTDDGSSWYNISQNFFFMAERGRWTDEKGTTVHQGNVVYQGAAGRTATTRGRSSRPRRRVRGQQVRAAHSDNLGNLFYDCDCPGASHSTRGRGGDDPEHGAAFAGNQYFTKDANATVSCSDPPRRGRTARHNEPDATLEALPTDDELLDRAPRPRADRPRRSSSVRVSCDCPRTRPGASRPAVCRE